MLPDYYHALDLPPDASLSQIKSAYRRLSLEHHPDRTGRADDDAQFRRIKEAYETLSDAQRRAEYDRQRRRPQRSGSPGRSGPIEEVGPRRAKSHFSPPSVSSPGTLDLEVVLSPAEVIRGGRLPLQIPLTVACPSCHGSGQIGFWICPACDGEGATAAAARLDVLLPSRLREGQVVPIFLRQGIPGGLLLRLHIHVGE